MATAPKTNATLYVVPGSHPSMAGRLMLEHKGIDYHRVDLIAALHKPILRALGFSDTTVPALRIDGRRIQGTLNISRGLDDLCREPPLFPADEERRGAVEEAESWGEGVLQPVPRRLSWWALRKDRTGLRSLAKGARLHVPLGFAIATAAPIIWTEVRINGASDAAAQKDLAALPAMLDKVEQWLEEGVLGHTLATAADYQIATSIRLLMCFEDLRETIAARPAGTYARELVPEFPGDIPAVLPKTWISNLS